MLICTLSKKQEHKRTANMAIPFETTITTNVTTDLVEIKPGAQGATVSLSGTFGGATVELGRKDRTGQFRPYTSSDASKTAAGEISVQAGAGTKLALRTSGGTAHNILAEVAQW